MSTIKSSSEHLVLNSDGSGKEVKIQRNGTQVMATTASGIDVTGSVTADAVTMAAGKEIQLGNSGEMGFFNSSGVSHIRVNSGTFKLRADDMRFTAQNGTTEKLRIQSGGGISFNGDTASANALDDYEEGTHQYTITGTSGGSMTPRSGYNHISYTKIGRLVTVQGRWETSGSHTANGQLKFSLPFAAGNATAQSGTGGGFISIYRAGSIYRDLEARVNEGDSFFYIIYQHDTYNDEYLTGSNVDSSIEGIVSFSYMAAF